MKLIDWIKPSFEDNNGNASGRRITAFWFVVLSTVNAWIIGFGIIGLIVMIQLKGLDYDERMVDLIDRLLTLELYLLGMVLLLWGVVTSQNILQFMSMRKETQNTATNQPMS